MLKCLKGSGEKLIFYQFVYKDYFISQMKIFGIVISPTYPSYKKTRKFLLDQKLFACLRAQSNSYSIFNIIYPISYINTESVNV